MLPFVKCAWYKLDFLIVGVIFAIVAIGLYYLKSVNETYFWKQLTWLGVSVIALIFWLIIDYRWLLRRAYWFYGAAFLLLIIVLLQDAVRGAKSWINLSVFSVQPSEIMKLALIVVLARYLGNRDNQWTIRGLLMPFLLLFLPLILILKQPDLGTGILLPPILFLMLYASGARILHLGTVALAGIISIAPLWIFVLKEYQKNRIRAFIDPELYSAREAWQLIQSLIAIGSGGFYGMGWGEGNQNTLDLLPDKHTDFIFGIIAEEGGFLAAGGLSFLFLLLVLGGLHIARECRDPRAKLIAVGISALIGVQALINIGVVTAVLPTTGITLPLVSYGGTSLLITFSMLGLLLNVGMNNELTLYQNEFTGGKTNDE